MVCREAARRPTASAIKAWSGCAAVVLALHAWLLTLWPQPPLPALHLQPLEVQLRSALPGGPRLRRPADTAPPKGPLQAATHAGERTARKPAGSRRTTTAATALSHHPMANIEPLDASPSAGAAPVALSAPAALQRTRVGAPPTGHVAHLDTAAVSMLDLPVYATALPAAGRWHYRVLHDGRVGDAELQWQHDGAGYSAQLTARDTEGAPVLALSSRGRIDGAGLAPERFVDRRGRRSAQAANFQRDAGAITYSGPALHAALPVGAQDRLSQWLQLSAIVAAAPGRWSAGSTITTYATGAHGDAEVWRWQVLGLVAADADAGAVASAGSLTLKLWRPAPRLYDTEAEAWLDPARGYLPSRLRWRNGPHVVELRLQP